MPSLTETVILENHPSAQQYPDTVKQYLEDEVEAGRMDGPFSHDTIKSILRGPFFVSPLIVSVQPQGLGMPDKLRVCRHLSKSNKLTPSVNSHTRKEDFPTRFDTASWVADIVSILAFFDSNFFPSSRNFLYSHLYDNRYLKSLFTDVRPSLLPQTSTFVHYIQIGTTSSNPSSTLLVSRASAGVPAGTRLLLHF